jgi:hypothetical protein
LGVVLLGFIIVTKKVGGVFGTFFVRHFQFHIRILMLAPGVLFMGNSFLGVRRLRPGRFKSNLNFF